MNSITSQNKWNYSESMDSVTDLKKDISPNPEKSGIQLMVCVKT